LLGTARKLGITKGRTERRLRDHRVLIATDSTYSRRAAWILHTELRRMIPGAYLRKRADCPVRKKSRGA
ncbi:MAG: hypothetical protein ACYST0_13475, partial [Planctomycetota bacterium]